MAPKSVLEFIRFWFIRYLLVTEMYMVETWERVIMHVIFVVLFVAFWYFNSSVVLSGVHHLRSWQAVSL